MKKLKELLFLFVCVTTGIVFASALFTTVFLPQEELGSELLWQILFVSALCSLGRLIYPEHIPGKKEVLLLSLLHYSMVNVIVLGCGIYFEWFYVNNLPMVLAMLALIAVIFIVISIGLWKRDVKLARQMNEMLKEYQKGED